MNEKKFYKVIFNTVGNIDYTLTIKDANEFLTPLDILNSLEKVLDSNVIKTENGDLSEILKAELSIRNIDDILV